MQVESFVAIKENISKDMPGLRALKPHAVLKNCNRGGWLRDRVKRRDPLVSLDRGLTSLFGRVPVIVVSRNGAILPKAARHLARTIKDKLDRPLPSRRQSAKA